MQTQANTQTTTPFQDDDYVTIVAPSMAEVMGQFRARGLSAQGYKIAGRVCRHTFAFAGQTEGNDESSSEMFDGDLMMAATFVRSLATSN